METPLTPVASSALSLRSLPALCAALALSGPAAANEPQVAVPPDGGPPGPIAPAGLRAFPLGHGQFTVLERESGPHNYYRTIDEPPPPLIRGVYRPGLATVILFAQVPDELRRGARRLRWRWRALVLPHQGNECEGDRADSAANVYVTWRRGLRWYSLKFVWSTEAKEGAVCAGKRNPFVAQDSIVLRSGGPVWVWRDEDVDLELLFRKHFESGDPTAELPDLAGIGIMTDGDQTRSAAAADFSGFVLFK
jgi:hypothetical protein